MSGEAWRGKGGEGLKRTIWKTSSVVVVGGVFLHVGGSFKNINKED